MSWWDDLWNNVNRPVNFAPQTVNIHSKDANPLSDPDQAGHLYEASQYNKALGRNNGPDAFTGKSADITPQRASAPLPEYGGGGMNLDNLNAQSNAVGQANQQQQQDGGNDLLSMLKQALDASAIPAQNPYMSGLDQARSASLKAIADARNQTQSNFNDSNAAIQGIYQKGKQDTLADGQVLADSNANLTGGLKAMYDGSINQLQNDRTKEMSDRADMMNRLGIQAAGIGDAGQTQTQAIANASQNSQAAQNKALQYGGADQTDNVARANGLISEGASKQAALRSQLAGVLGQLTGKELDINNNYANQAMQANNQDYQDRLGRVSSIMGMIDKQQTLNQNAQKNVLQSRLLSTMYKDGSGGGASGNGTTNIQDANNFLSQQGINPSDYNSAYSDAILNSQAMPGTNPSEQQLLQYMHQKNPNLDLNQLISYVRNASNSSKYNSTTGGNPAVQSAIMGMLQ